MGIVFANVISPEILIVAGVVVLLFGGSQLPKLARSIGQAKHEFEKGQEKEVDETTKPKSEETPPTPPSKD